MSGRTRSTLLRRQRCWQRWMRGWCHRHRGRMRTRRCSAHIRPLDMTSRFSFTDTLPQAETVPGDGPLCHSRLQCWISQFPDKRTRVIVGSTLTRTGGAFGRLIPRRYLAVRQRWHHGVRPLSRLRRPKSQPDTATRFGLTASTTNTTIRGCGLMRFIQATQDIRHQGYINQRRRDSPPRYRCLARVPRRDTHLSRTKTFNTLSTTQPPA